MSDTTRAVQQGGNLRRAVQALWLAIDAGPGHAITIRRLETGTIEVVALPQGQDAKAKGQRVKPRVGMGSTLTDALTDLAGKMGLNLPPTEG